MFWPGFDLIATRLPDLVGVADAIHGYFHRPATEMWVSAHDLVGFAPHLREPQVERVLRTLAQAGYVSMRVLIECGNDQCGGLIAREDFERAEAESTPAFCPLGNHQITVHQPVERRLYAWNDVLAHSAQGPSSTQEDEDESVKIVFIAGDRGGSQHNQAQIPREIKAIEKGIRGGKHPRALRLIKTILAATHGDIVGASDQSPEILHFAGHGDDRSLSVIRDQGLLVNSTPISADQLASILQEFPGSIRMCLLNTCNSESIAKQLVELGGAHAAIGWPGRLADEAAIAFSEAFYKLLGDGLELSRSVKLAAGVLSSGASPMLFAEDPDETYVSGED